MILVTGASGTVGLEVVKQLAAGGHRVRAMTRNPELHAFPGGVEVVMGDFDQPDTLPKALKGVQKAFLLTAGEQLAVHDAAFVGAAQKAGVMHIAKLSVMGAGHGSKDPITLWHKAGEEVIQRSGLAWTFVRPGGFMSNALMWADSIKTQGTVYAPFGHDKVAVIDPHDIAAVATCALTQPGHEGRVYELSGPEALTPEEQVKKISKATGRPIRFIGVELKLAEDNMKARGMPAVLADAIIQSLAQAQRPFSAEVLDTVAKVTGREPRSFDEWLEEHVAAFGM